MTDDVKFDQFLTNTGAPELRSVDGLRALDRLFPNRLFDPSFDQYLTTTQTWPSRPTGRPLADMSSTSRYRTSSCVCGARARPRCASAAGARDAADALPSKRPAGKLVRLPGSVHRQYSHFFSFCSLHSTLIVAASRVRASTAAADIRRPASRCRTPGRVRRVRARVCACACALAHARGARARANRRPRNRRQLALDRERHFRVRYRPGI